VVRDRSVLADELVETIFRNSSQSLLIAIDAMIRAGGLPVDANAEANRTRARPQNKVQIPRMEAEENAAVRSAKHRRLAVIGPCARETPLIGFELSRRKIQMQLAGLQAAGRGKALCPHGADIGFRRAKGCAIGGHFRSAGAQRKRAGRRRLRSVAFFQELPNPALRFVVVSLAEVLEADLSRGIDEVMRGPVLIVKGAPDALLAVNRDR